MEVNGEGITSWSVGKDVTELSPRFGAERELEWESPESVCTVTEKPEEESVVVKGNKKMSKVCQFY